MQTAAQHNMPLVGQVDLPPPPPPTADELRTAMVKQFEEVKPHLDAYHGYAMRISELAIAYHEARLADAFPKVQVEELTLAVTLDARETPKSLDTKLAQLASENIIVRKIVFDRVKTTYLLFV